MVVHVHSDTGHLQYIYINTEHIQAIVCVRVCVYGGRAHVCLCIQPNGLRQLLRLEGERVSSAGVDTIGH